jgi:putative ABC transport system permease protein
MKILNYLKISLRTLFLHRGFSLLTLIGLSVGIAMSIFVLEYVLYQFSFDQHYDRSDDIYRVVSEGRLENETVNAALSPIVLAKVMDKYSEVEALTRIVDASEKAVQSNYTKSFETEIIYADSSFFSVFSRPFLLGDGSEWLADSACVAISRSAASRLFGSRNPIGEKIRINETDSFEVSAVFTDVPQNSHFKYDFVLPYSIIEKKLRDHYGPRYDRISESFFSLVCYTYFKAKPGTDVRGLLDKMRDEIRPAMEAEDLEVFGENSDTEMTYAFQPLRHIYLFSDNDFELGETANAIYVFIFLGVALFILLVTAFNFMNLTTARALDRAREAGVRLIFGAHKRNLVVQFISESVLFSFVALFLGLVMVELLLPVFNNLFTMDFFDSSVREHLNLPLIFMITLMVGVFSGSYPAFVFSRIRASDLQTGQNNFSVHPGLWLRGLLVLVQVFVAVLVITTAIGMYRQLNYVTNADLGFNAQGLMMIERARYLESLSDSVVHEIEKLEEVSHVSELFNVPGEALTVMSFNYTGDSGSVFLLSVYSVDCSLFETLGARLKSGSLDCGDSTNVLINEKAALLFNGSNVEGEKLQVLTHEDGDRVEFNITGIVEDIYLEGMKHTLRPALYVPAGASSIPESILLRVSEGGKAQAVKDIQSIWDHAGTGAPFVMSSMEDRINSFYQEDARYNSLATAFAILVLIISSLGMIGLVSFILATRQQDILLKRISGFPDFHNLWGLFSGYFLFVASGIALAMPVSQLLLRTWAGSFTNHYVVDYLCFIMPGLVMLFIASAIAWYAGKRLLGRMSFQQF